MRCPQGALKSFHIFLKIQKAMLVSRAVCKPRKDLRKAYTLNFWLTLSCCLRRIEDNTYREQTAKWQM